MKELDPMVFLAVFQEMLGPWLWVLVAVAALGIAGFAYVLVRDRGLSSGRFILAEIVGVVGGFAAIFFMWWITSSSLADIGGPVDLLLVVGIWAAGFVGWTILAYAGIGLRAPRRQA
jgi:hypothetical protein